MGPPNVKRSRNEVPSDSEGRTQGIDSDEDQRDGDTAAEKVLAFIYFFLF